MPVWLIVLIAAGIGGAWMFSKRTSPTSGGRGTGLSPRGGMRGSGGSGMFGSFKPPANYTPSAGIGRPAGPSSYAMRDADRMRGDGQFENQREMDRMRDQELEQERAYHHEQQRIDDDYVNSGGYY